MDLTHNLNHLYTWLTHSRFARVPRTTMVLVGAGLCGCIVLAYAVSYFIPKTTNLSFTGATCFSKPTLLPRLHKLDSSTLLSASFSNTKNIGSYPVVASSVCVSAVQAPQANTTQTTSIKLLGLPFITSKTQIKTPSFPGLQSASKATLSGTISTKDSLTFALDKPDAIFNYYLATATTRTVCAKQNSTLSCDVSKLNLAQAQTYKLSLSRTFNDKTVDTLLTSTVATVTPISVTATSIGTGTVVYDAPRTLTITFNKPIATYKDVSLKRASGVPVPHTVTPKDNTLILSFTEALPRDTAITLGIGDVRATDKGFLSQPYTLSFTTSGGPKVVGRNIGSYGVAANSTIRLTFDVAVQPADAARYFQIHGNGGIIPATMRVADNTITLSPTRSFGLCEQFTVKVLDGLQNVYGITGGSAWQFSSRAICHTTFSIGTSAQGRSIVAYKFGSGPSTVLYVGATHGSEPSSKYTLDSWVSYLESRAPELPAHRSIVIVPSINPDGIAHGSRTNARGVDLNRNFPANSWKADVVMPGGQPVVNGGGATPLSEPESIALASYTLAVRPRLVLTYHAKGSIVTANESGDSMALATKYGRSVGYRVIAESQLGNTFQYDTTGAYENWLHDKASIPTLLIELPGHSGNYFTSNRNAMWTMATL